MFSSFLPVLIILPPLGLPATSCVAPSAPLGSSWPTSCACTPAGPASPAPAPGRSLAPAPATARIRSGPLCACMGISEYTLRNPNCRCLPGPYPGTGTSGTAGCPCSGRSPGRPPGGAAARSPGLPGGRLRSLRRPLPHGPGQHHKKDQPIEGPQPPTHGPPPATGRTFSPKCQEVPAVPSLPTTHTYSHYPCLPALMPRLTRSSATKRNAAPNTTPPQNDATSISYYFSFNTTLVMVIIAQRANIGPTHHFDNGIASANMSVATTNSINPIIRDATFIILFSYKIGGGKKHLPAS